MSNGVSSADIIDTYKELGSIRATARQLRVSPKRIKKTLNSAIRNEVKPICGATLNHKFVPDGERSVNELLAAKKETFDRRKAMEEAAALFDVSVNIDGPIGIVHMGDPHIEDDSTDIALLESHLRLVRETEGMYGANVGDFKNNWIGRLSQLYAHNTVTAKEGWKLVEWMIGQCEGKWVYLVGGNHDFWSGDNDPLEWIAKQHNAPLRYHGQRINLKFPNGKSIRINTRHDFSGSSQWNNAHAPMKAASMGFKDHIYTCGHRHTTGYGIVASPILNEPLVSHCIRVAAYKVFDEYADQRGFVKTPTSPAAVTIIDPKETNPWRVVQVFWDVEHGTDYLNWLRKQK